MDPDVTIDPMSQARAGMALPTEKALIVIAFHSDLSRIGERALLDGDSHSVTMTNAVQVGRNHPLFGRGGRTFRPLSDPCVSRHQFSIVWNGQARVFRITPDPSARRPVTAFLPNGQPVPLNAVPVDGLVRIGDRVIFLVTTIPITATEKSRLNLVGETTEIWRVRNRIRAVARAVDTALIFGETGVGKELVARAIHDASPRHRGPFLSLNCAALPNEMVESELFGHRRGAFTGANESAKGVFRAAEGGTVFLDEIGELPLATQAKLLRILQEKRVRPVGESQEIPVDVRVVAATNRDLEKAVADNTFRDDLFARLVGLTVHVPPLKDRAADAPLLFAHFMQQQRSTDRGALERLWTEANNEQPPVPIDFFLSLLSHHWPRNVREVQKLAAEVAALNDDPQARQFINPTWPRELTHSVGPAAVRTTINDDPNPYRKPAELDETTVMDVLQQYDFVQKRAADALGISRTSLDKLMQELGVLRPHDLTLEHIQKARLEVGDNLSEMARYLKVSQRGLKLRLTALEIEGQ